jgi:hypothetical protein
MDTLPEKEKMMRDYWLESLSDSQVETFETEWFGNDDDSELLAFVRTDLIDDYLTNNLNKTERLQFEKHFLPNNLEDTVLAKSLIEISSGSFDEPAKTGLFERLAETVRNFGRVPQVALALLFLACFGLFFGYLIKSFTREPEQIARNIEPEINVPNSNSATPKIIETGSNKLESNSGIVKEPINPKVEPKPENHKTIIESNKVVVTEPKTTAENKVPIEIEKPIRQQVLFLTALRGSPKTLKLSSLTDTFLLKTEMPGIDKAYKNYEIRIYDANKNLVVKQPIGENMSAKKSGENINIPSLKTNKLKKNNTYKTLLVGIDEKNEVTELCVYDSFKVN